MTGEFIDKAPKLKTGFQKGAGGHGAERAFLKPGLAQSACGAGVGGWGGKASDARFAGRLEMTIL
jgi:hypothetical protein